MTRRDVLKTSTGIVGAAFVDAPPRREAPQVGRAEASRRGPFVETRDGQQLFVKDWGAGPPVVFLAAWALPSDMWDYQMVPLSEQGLRCMLDRYSNCLMGNAASGRMVAALVDPSL